MPEHSGIKFHSGAFTKSRTSPRICKAKSEWSEVSPFIDTHSLSSGDAQLFLVSVRGVFDLGQTKCREMQV